MYGEVEEPEGLEEVEGDRFTQLKAQLRCVFEACDTDSTGQISLQDLANISRSHVSGSSQVEQILDIFDTGSEEGAEDRLDFSQFYNRVVSYLGETPTGGMLLSPSANIVSPPPGVQGTFNENLRRSFDKSTSSPVRSPGKKAPRRRKNSSQAKLTGRIPLVNTSSEDDMDDSFDRKIAVSLEMARPMDIRPDQFLVRGSLARSTTLRKLSSGKTPQGHHRRASFHESHSTPGGGLPSPQRRSSTISGMSPIVALPGRESVSSASPLSSTAASSGRESPADTRGSFAKHSDTSNARLVISSLERTVEQLQETAVGRQEEGYDSPSSGVGSLKVDLEEEITSSLQLTRRHWEERMETERSRHREQLASQEKERDLERRNFTLRFQQLQEERDRLKSEVENLHEKVRLIHSEKEQCEEQVSELLEEQRCRSPLTAVGENLEEQRVSDREQELLQTVERLSCRVAEQDELLAQEKEDNIVLRSQVRGLKETAASAKLKEGRFSIFGGRNKENQGDPLHYSDPSDLRAQLAEARAELQDQREVNTQLKGYMGEVLVNILDKDPNMLEVSRGSQRSDPERQSLNSWK